MKLHPAILEDERAQCDLAASFQAAVVESLTSRAGLALEQTGCTRLVVCGGVAANGNLRRALLQQAQAEGFWLWLPPVSLCTDNAAMVAALGYQGLVAGERLDLDGDVFSRG